MRQLTIHIADDHAQQLEAAAADASVPIEEFVSALLRRCTPIALRSPGAVVAGDRQLAPEFERIWAQMNEELAPLFTRLAG